MIACSQQTPVSNAFSNLSQNYYGCWWFPNLHFLNDNANLHFLNDNANLHFLHDNAANRRGRLIHVIWLKHLKITQWHLLPNRKAARHIGGHNFPLQGLSHHAGSVHLKCRNSSCHQKVQSAAASTNIVRTSDRSITQSKAAHNKSY